MTTPRKPLPSDTIGICQTIEHLRGTIGYGAMRAMHPQKLLSVNYERRMQKYKAAITATPRPA